MNELKYKIAIAKLLPERIAFRFETLVGENPNSNRTWYFYWTDGPAERQILETEWLYVMSLVEETLTNEYAIDQYHILLQLITSPEKGTKFYTRTTRVKNLICATFNQRAEAMCRVKNIKL